MCKKFESLRLTHSTAHINSMDEQQSSGSNLPMNDMASEVERMKKKWSQQKAD